MKRPDESGPGNDPKKSSSTKEPNKRKHLGKAGSNQSSNGAKESQRENEINQNSVEQDPSTKPESEVEKISRKGQELLEQFLKNTWNNLRLAEVRSNSLQKRSEFLNKMENLVMTMEFFESLEPNLKIKLLLGLDRGVQSETGLVARLQAQGDINKSYYNLKKLVDNLIFLETKKERKKLDKNSPYSPEFQELTRAEYRLRVMGLKPDPAKQTEEEEENGSEEVDENSAGKSEPGD